MDRLIILVNFRGLSRYSNNSDGNNWLLLAVFLFSLVIGGFIIYSRKKKNKKRLSQKEFEAKKMEYRKFFKEHRARKPRKSAFEKRIKKKE